MTRDISGRESNGDGDDGGGPTATRRSVLRAAAAGAAGLAVGSGAIGSSGAAGIPTPPLVRGCNGLHDPTGQQVILRGVTIADPGRQLRPERRQTADETVALALDGTARPSSGTLAGEADVEGWHNDVIRIPIQPQDVYAGTDNASADPASAMPHGDAWGPVMPGETGDSPAPITAETLTEYVEEVLDPLIDQIEDAGAYAMLSYHRHYPAFHQVAGPADGCDSALEYDGTTCGERGVLWHGADQVEDVEANAPSRVVDATDVEPWTEPTAVAEALDEEVRTFWAFVANEYADRDHVCFDVYAHPGGPYAKDWGGAERMPVTSGDSVPPPGPREHPVWWDMWLERAQPWIDVVDEHAPGSVATIGSPQWSRYTYHAGITGEFDVDALQLCYTGQIRMQENFDLADQFGPPSEQVPLFFTDFGWAEGGGRHESGFLAATTTGDGDGRDARSGKERFEPFVEEYPVHPIASYFDPVWEPTFFDHEGATGTDAGDLMDHLAEYESRPGQWWMRYLYETRGEYDPERGDGRPASVHCREPPEPTEPSVPQVGGDRPTDPDADGLYEDVNGNGDGDLADAVDLYQHRDGDAVQDNVDAFDFSGNDAIDLADVVQLYQENTA